MDLTLLDMRIATTRLFRHSMKRQLHNGSVALGGTLPQALRGAKSSHTVHEAAELMLVQGGMLPRQLQSRCTVPVSLAAFLSDSSCWASCK